MLSLEPPHDLAQVAVDCLIQEAELTPKPGLVDRRGGGAHDDMSLALMRTSAQALKPTFEHIARVCFGKKPDVAIRVEIGRIGRDGEAAMYKATGGVNTHKGAIWTLGLLTAAVAMHSKRVTPHELTETAARLARIPDVNCPKITTESHGDKVKRLYQMQGAREEAANGFPHITSRGLLCMRRDRASGLSEQICSVHALLSIMSNLSDTCVLSRGGLEGLNCMQQGARSVLELGGLRTVQGQIAFAELDEMMARRKLSPGGAADLLAGTFFTDQVTR